LSSLCTLLGYTRQAFYGNRKHHLQEIYDGELIIQQVLKHRELQPKIGTRKLLLLIQDFVHEHHLDLGRDALFDLLREHHLLIRKRKRNVQTTFSRHRFKKYKNLIRDFVPLAPNLLWVSDITYIAVADEFGYLSLITDAYSRKIVGYCLSKTLEASGSVKALQMALDNSGDITDLMHHSDRGVQYCCNDYVKMLTDKSIKISMTENGDPLENAIAERVNGILKCELLQEKYNSFEEAKSSVEKAGVIYNTLRPHSSCDMLTPVQAHKKEGALKKHWKNYYKKKEVIMKRQE
jgi:transposase InsO family protein